MLTRTGTQHTSCRPVGHGRSKGRQRFAQVSAEVLHAAQDQAAYSLHLGTVPAHRAGEGRRRSSCGAQPGCVAAPKEGEAPVAYESSPWIRRDKGWGDRRSQGANRPQRRRGQKEKATEGKQRSPNLLSSKPLRLQKLIGKYWISTRVMQDMVKP